jgi:hypothetical protein
MTDDICGAECGDGSECEHPAGSCPIASHGDEGAENAQGVASKLEESRDAVFQAARQGATIAGCARAAGVDESTLYRWLDKHDEFAEEFRKARSDGELRHIDNVNDRGSQFLLERSYGYTKSQEIEHSGDGLGDVHVSFTDDEDDE